MARYGAGVGALTAFSAGIITKKIGKRKSLVSFSVLRVITALYFLTQTYIETNTVLILIGITLLWGTYGMLSVLIYTLSMDKVREGREGTDFTIQIVLTHLSSLIIAVSNNAIITIKKVFDDKLN